MARRRDRSPDQQWPTQRRTTTGSPWVAVLGVVGVIAGLILARSVTEAVAPVLYRWADADHGRLVALLMVLWAAGPLLVLAAVELKRRERPWASRACWVPAGFIGLVAIGSIPGRRDNGQRARDLTDATGALPLAGSGDVFVAAAVAALIAFVVVCPLLAGWVLKGDGLRGAARPRVVVGALVYVGGWVLAGVLVVSVVGDTEPRITWLEDTAEVLAGGDDGVTGGFHIGLDASVLDVVDCDTAADRLRVDGREPELDGCRRALLVAATGRYDRDGVRTSSGDLVAVVVQVGDAGELEDLDDALDGAEILAGGGLPEPSGDVLTTPASAALALVVAAEDTGDIPLPAEGAGRRPLSRALAYVAIGTAVGLYVSPPEETPASP